mmetsp:Transcript_23733/g.27448  ORF Transcript_23733/g.27448 Transcript_23733/m.27448 type:complete len:332 (-) Transcript_23733:66-1061(-)
MRSVVLKRRQVKVSLILINSYYFFLILSNIRPLHATFIRPFPTHINIQTLSPTTFISQSSQTTLEARGDKKKGYQFGDITKSLINKITHNDEYEFGDLSRHIDNQIKDNIAKLNNKNKYEFGDLTKYIVQDFTNSTDQYKFGDITNEIISRVKSKQYTMEDLALLMKGLVSFGVGISPVASVLPIKLLIDLLNYSIAGDLGNKVVASITLELDKRMKKAIVGDENYKVGDLTKKAISEYTGRGGGEYRFGDITKTVLESLEKYDELQKEVAQRNSMKKELDEKDKYVIDVKVVEKTEFLEDGAVFEKVRQDLEKWDDEYLNNLKKENNTKS